MNHIQGVPILGLMPDDNRISDEQLIQQILVLSRIWYFLYGNEGVVIEPERMKQNYGVLLCDSDLEPLANEARVRSSHGSEKCRIFFGIVDTIKAKYSSMELPDAMALICHVHEIRRDPLIKDGGRIDADGDLSYWLSPIHSKGIAAPFRPDVNANLILQQTAAGKHVAEMFKF